MVRYFSSIEMISASLQYRRLRVKLREFFFSDSDITARRVGNGTFSVRGFLRRPHKFLDAMAWREFTAVGIIGTCRSLC